MHLFMSECISSCLNAFIHVYFNVGPDVPDPILVEGNAVTVALHFEL